MYMVPAEQGWVKSKPRVTTVSTFLIQYGTMSLFLVSLDDGGLETLQNRHGQGYQQRASLRSPDIPVAKLTLKLVIPST
jgi:hypothetical protein